MVQRTGQAAKLPFPVHPHMLRHSTGYKLANQGEDTRSLAHYLGHRNLQSTARYTALAPDRFKGLGSDDLLGNTIGEIFLLGITAHILEWQDRDGRPVRQRQCLLGLCRAAIQTHTICAHWPSDILELLFASVVETYVQLISHLLIRSLGNANAAGL